MAQQKGHQVTRDIHDGGVRTRLDKAIGCGDRLAGAVVQSNAMSKSVTGIRMG